MVIKYYLLLGKLLDCFEYINANHINRINKIRQVKT